MDIRTGETYETREAALAAGVPDSDIAEVKWTRQGPEPTFTNPKHPVRHQGNRERARRREQIAAASVNELDRQKRDGVGVFNPRFMEEDDYREAQDNTPSLGPFTA